MAGNVPFKANVAVAGADAVLALAKSSVPADGFTLTVVVPLLVNPVTVTM